MSEVVLSPAQAVRYSQLYRQLAAREAADSFAAFRRYLFPDLLWGWWVQEVSVAFDHFYLDWVDGKRPKLAVYAPPQHGKSRTAEEFMAWFAGKQSLKKMIFASYSDDLGVRTNNNLRRIMASDRYLSVFPNMRIGGSGKRFLANSDHIQFWDVEDYSDTLSPGEFRNTTVQGPINGMGLDLGGIDDPMKGRAEAHSKAVRDKTWNWFTDDFLGRFDKDAAMFVIMTRWHVDDPMGRFQDRWKGENFKVVSYPAIAEKNELYRRKGEALFPEHKPLSWLLERKSILTQASWESLYQQNPIVVGGGQLPIEKIRFMSTWSPHDSDIIASVRYWDKAGSDTKGSSWSAGVLMHKMKDGRFVISHVVRGQWLSRDRNKHIKLWTAADAGAYKNYQVGVEQEPGSGGKESAEMTVAMLAGFRVFVDKVTGNKEVRAQPFAAQVQGSNVWLVAGDWCSDYLDEAEVWPQGTKDQIDASSGSFNHIAKATSFDSSFSWVG